jgi:hypothetical protein
VAIVTRRRGRPYQPYPQRTSNWKARLLVAIVAVALVVTVLITFGSSR